MSQSPSAREEQRQHFERARNQYPPSSIEHPPLHTEIEQQRILDAVAPIPAGAAVLDFGAGTGRLTIPLARLGYRVTAVDISETSLAELAALTARLGLPDVTVSTTLPAGQAFSAIVGADILHHVDLDDCLPELYKALEPGGRLVFTEPGGMNPVWYVYLSLAYDFRVERRIVHSNLRTLPKAFVRHGFRDVRITGIGLLPRPVFGRSRALCEWHDRAGNVPIARWFAYRYLIEARK
jgi:2-polyprenyl-3-methyl-5-hydroxy-6-metoxy-1,4-benzoquinol methylase